VEDGHDGPEAEEREHLDEDRLFELIAAEGQEHEGGEKEAEGEDEGAALFEGNAVFEGRLHLWSGWVDGWAGGWWGMV
jgi:hypothetical protein